MEYFISWYPNPPDPRYWDWFKIDGLMISFASLRGRTLRKALTLGLHQFTGFKGRIFLDSGAFQYGKKGTRKSQIEVLELQRWLDPDLVSHLDKPYINLEEISEETRWNMLKDTIENAKLTSRWERRNDIQVVYVIQGWNHQSLRVCAEKMSRLDADYYGVGSLYRQPRSEVVKRMKLVRRIIGRKPKLHVFGVSPPRVDQDQIEGLKEVFDLVDSFDSSSPVRAATVKEVIDPVSRKREHIDYVSELSSNCDCPICEQFPNRVRLLGLRGSRKQYTRLRAIHNAYWITNLAHCNEKS